MKYKKSKNPRSNICCTNSIKSTESLESIKRIESIKSHKGYIFSFYKSPIANKYPERSIDLFQCYQLIKNGYKDETKHLRSITDANQYREHKTKLLDYVTFAGTFDKRHRNSIKQLSGLMCLDFDHLNNISAKKRKIKSDPFLDVLMVFTSPGGDGIKVIVENPYNEDYSSDYKQVQEHIWRRYGLKVDNTSDVARACFLCHDPYIWIAEHLQQDRAEIPSSEFLQLKEIEQASHLNFHSDLQVKGYYDRLMEVLRTN